MRSVSVRLLVAGFMLVGTIAGLNLSPAVHAEEVGGIEAGKWVLGMRAGFAPVTQTVSEGQGLRTSTDVGSLVNFQAMYSLNKWLLVGMMLEWERHGMSEERPNRDLGHLDTVSLLPTVEIRPVKFGSLVPYANMSFGVNVNSFGESSAIRRTTISPSNNFAWRLGWGADYMITKQIALNTEMAYKRNDGHATLTDTAGNQLRLNDWNASSFGFLFGVKMFF
jgi:opacity protein-like surface antigen